MRNSARWALLSALAISGCATHQPGATITGTAPAVDSAEPKADTPITANTHFAAGQLAETQGDVPRAIAQYQAALAVDPKFQPALLRLGMAYTGVKQFDAAIDIWRRYITATNDSAAGYCNLALTLELDQRTNEAESAYKSAVARDPKNEPARVNFGLLLARLGRLDDAAAQLQAVLTPAEAHYDVASVLESQGKNDAARSQYREALRLDPNMNDAKTRLANLDTDDTN
jgi:tetratricopeptide (TPR) repeat protein